jgi:uncharacterized damage-inducible protein DinB
MATIREVLETPQGYACAEVALFMSQLDDQSARLFRDLHDIGPDELEWQPAPGMNTIGMLLAHNAIVEVFWTDLGLLGKPVADPTGPLGIGLDDDGMPIPPEGLPPPNLAGKPLAYFRDLLDKARNVVKRTAATLTEKDLPGMRTRTRRNGQVEDFNVRWVLYHLVEHFAGHYGQILLLRHQYRAAASARSVTAPGA